MPQFFVSIGSNINPAHHVSASLDALERHFSPLIISPVYECDPVGFDGDNFLNLVVAFDSDLTIAKVAQILRQIETDSGRVRTANKLAPRTLDLDIIACDKLVGIFDGITLPHPETTKFAFVIKPMADIAGEQMHPVAKVSYQQLWQDFDKPSQPIKVIDFYWHDKALG